MEKLILKTDSNRKNLIRTIKNNILEQIDRNDNYDNMLYYLVVKNNNFSYAKQYIQIAIKEAPIEHKYFIIKTFIDNALFVKKQSKRYKKIIPLINPLTPILCWDIVDVIASFL